MSPTIPYLVKPGALWASPAGAGVLALPGMWPGSTFDPSRGEAVTALSGGGTAVFRNLNAKRSYNLVYTSQLDPGSNILDMIYRGLLDDPLTMNWVFVDPTVRNMLSLDAAATGARSAAAIEWVASAGAVSVSTAVAASVLGAGVLGWVAPANGILTVGSSASTVNPAKGHPYIPAEPLTVSVWGSSTNTASVSFGVQGYNAAGTAVSGALVSGSYTWAGAPARYSATVPAGASAFSGCTFVRPVVSTGSTAPTGVVLISAAQLEYSSSASAWQPGHGSPRVVITSSIGRAVQIPGASDRTLTMAEC